MSRESRPVGRRPGDPEETRNAILVAARQCFAEFGFERATIRAIAERADVDPALVMHYFKTKQQLFAAAHRMPVDPEAMIQQLVELDLDRRTRAMARFYFANLLSDGAPRSRWFGPLPPAIRRRRCCRSSSPRRRWPPLGSWPRGPMPNAAWP